MSWANHVHEIAKKVSSSIWALKRVRPFISKETAIQIYKALIQPRFDYCSAVWDGLNSSLSEKLQKLQNLAARVITSSSYDRRSARILSELRWDSLQVRRNKQKAKIMFKTMNKSAPLYLQQMFTDYSATYNLRNCDRKVCLPKPNTDYLKRSFSYSGAMLWNSLPEQARKATSINTFAKEIDGFFCN